MFWTRRVPYSRKDTGNGNLDYFNRFFAPSGFAPTASFPACNIWSNNEETVITSEIPGVELTGLEITVAGKDVIISGSRPQEENDKGFRHVRQERQAGTFTRRFRTEYAIDAGKVEARLANGVLAIRLPRAENEKPRKIAISAVD